VAAAEEEEEKEEEEEDNNDDNVDHDPVTTVHGVHHPKIFLLFERSGSLVVVSSTSNLTPQTAMEGSALTVAHIEARQVQIGKSSNAILSLVNYLTLASAFL
jgi:hypothetical protein